MGQMMLVVPPALETTGRQLVGSAFLPNSATNGGESNLLNTFQSNTDSGIAGVQVCPYLSDANDWMLLQTLESYRCVNLWYRDPIQLIATAMDWARHRFAPAFLRPPPPNAWERKQHNQEALSKHALPV